MPQETFTQGVTNSDSHKDHPVWQKYREQYPKRRFSVDEVVGDLAEYPGAVEFLKSLAKASPSETEQIRIAEAGVLVVKLIESITAQLHEPIPITGSRQRGRDRMVNSVTPRQAVMSR